MVDEPQNKDPETEEHCKTLCLEAREYGTIGVVHCGVTRDGLVAIGGRQIELEDGEVKAAENIGITVRREGEQYTFSETA